MAWKIKRKGISSPPLSFLCLGPVGLSPALARVACFRFRTVAYFFCIGPASIALDRCALSWSEGHFCLPAQQAQPTSAPLVSLLSLCHAGPACGVSAWFSSFLASDRVELNTDRDYCAVSPLLANPRTPMPYNSLASTSVAFFSTLSQSPPSERTAEPPRALTPSPPSIPPLRCFVLVVSSLFTFTASS